MKTDSRLPLEPLFNIASTMSDNPVFTAEDLSSMIGLSSRAIARWKAEGGIPWISADEAAIAMGLHPLLVWGDEWLNVKGDFDKLARAAEREMAQEIVDEIVDEGLDG